MDLNALRDFVAVVKHQSFSGAARAMRIPKSTVSARVQALEASLGVRLLERTTRALRLTEDGIQLHGRAVFILAEVAEVERVLTDGNSNPTGHLRVSAPYLLGEALLGELAARFIRHHPQVTLDIELSDRRVDLVEDNFDIAIRVGPIRDTSLITRLIAVTRQRLVVAPDIDASALAVENPADLARVPFVLFGPGGVQREVKSLHLLQGNQKIDVKINGAISLTSLAAVRKAVLAGAGFAILPEFIVAEDLKNGRLICKLNAWTETPIEIRAVFPSGRFMTRRSRAFIDFLVTEFPKSILS
jgi:DNA-binding transcriptional LysR family regulator